MYVRLAVEIVIIFFILVLTWAFSVYKGTSLLGTDFFFVGTQMALSVNLEVKSLFHPDCIVVHVRSKYFAVAAVE